MPKRISNPHAGDVVDLTQKLLAKAEAAARFDAENGMGAENAFADIGEGDGFDDVRLNATHIRPEEINELAARFNAAKTKGPVGLYSAIMSGLGTFVPLFGRLLGRR